MTRVFVQGQRQSGKSSYAMYEFMKNPEENLLIVDKKATALHMVSLIEKRFKVKGEKLELIRDRIRPALASSLHDEVGDTVIFDELLFCNEYEELLGEAAGRFENYIVYTTLYSKFHPGRREQKQFIKKLVMLGWNHVKLRTLKAEEEQSSDFGDLVLPEYPTPTQYKHPAAYPGTLQLTIPFPQSDLPLYG